MRMKDERIAGFEIAGVPYDLFGGGKCFVWQPLAGVFFLLEVLMLDEPAAMRAAQNGQPTERDRAIADRRPDGVRLRRAANVLKILMRRRRLLHVSWKCHAPDPQAVRQDRAIDEFSDRVDEFGLL